MAQGNFRAALEAVAWRPDFDGQDMDSAPGEIWGTRWGVTEMNWAQWQNAHPEAPEFPVATKDDFATLIQTNFWNGMRCEQMPKGLDLMVFDFGFTAGPGTSIRVLQTVLHRGNVKIAIDGMIGPLTVNETLHIADPAFPGQLGTLITQVAQQQLRYYQSLAKWPLYGRGWTRRNTACLDAALRMAGLKG